jgi:hypothetical protein
MGLRVCAIVHGRRDAHRARHRATSRDMTRRILHPREQYHFGPGRIAAYLHRFHQLTIADPRCIAYASATA